MGMGKEGYMAIVGMVSLEFIFAVMNIWNRQAMVKGLSPRIFVFYRQTFATLAILPIVYFSRGKSSNPPRMEFRTFLLIFVTAFIGGTLYQTLCNEGLYMASSSVTSAMSNLVPPLTFLIAAILRLEQVKLKEVSSIAKIVGTILCVGGATSMTFLRGQRLFDHHPQLPPSHSLSNSLLVGNQSWLLGCLLLFASVCCLSLYLILQVPVTKSYPDHLSFSAWMCFLSMIQTGIIALFFERHLQAWALNSTVELGACLFSGIFGTGTQYFIQFWCISRKGPLFVATFFPLSTVLTTFIASVFFHEEVYVGTLLGAIGVIVGLYVVLWGKAHEMEDKMSIQESTNCDITLEEPLLIDT